jgi:uncharacterized membrane protein
MPTKSPLHLLLLGCWAGLLLTLSAPLVLSETRSIGLWLMQVVPLLLTLPGVLKLRSRSLQWLAFLVLFYFLNGVLQASGAVPVQRWLGGLTLLLCLVVFTAVIVAVRRGRHTPPSSMQ